WRALLFFLCLQCLIAGLLATWRWWYFGDISPQSVNAKAAGILLANAIQGMQYLVQTWGNPWLLPFSSLIVLGAVYIIFVDKRLPLMLAVLLAAIYSVFVVISGG